MSAPVPCPFCWHGFGNISGRPDPDCVRVGDHTPAMMRCPKHGPVVPCDGDPGHPDGRRLCDPSVPHCPRNNCGRSLSDDDWAWSTGRWFVAESSPPAGPEHVFGVGAAWCAHLFVDTKETLDGRAYMVCEDCHAELAGPS